MKKIYQVVSNEGIDYMDSWELIKRFEIIGITFNSNQRSELQGEYKLKGLYGPMYNGVSNGKIVIRYETPSHYATYD